MAQDTSDATFIAGFPTLNTDVQRPEKWNLIFTWLGSFSHTKSVLPCPHVNLKSLQKTTTLEPAKVS